MTILNSVSQKFVRGEVYKTDPDFFLLVYPTRAAAGDVVRAAKKHGGVYVSLGRITAVATDEIAVSEAEYWSSRFKCQVRSVAPEVNCMVIDQSRDLRHVFLHVLFADFDGWIIYQPSWFTLTKLS